MVNRMTICPQMFVRGSQAALIDVEARRRARAVRVFTESFLLDPAVRTGELTHYLYAVLFGGSGGLV
jgi:hypothetical protein